MGKYSSGKKAAENDALLNAVNDNDKFESVKELLTMMSGKDDDKSFDQLVGAVITAALGENGAITTAITNAITAALGENGAIATAISNAITAAVGEGGAVTTAISDAITAAIGTDGSIETWGDGRYEPKQP